MVAAAFLIRDVDVLGRDIAILEDSDVIGGSLDGAVKAETGYVLRGVECSRASMSALSGD